MAYCVDPVKVQQKAYLGFQKDAINQTFEGEIKSFSDRVKWRWVFQARAIYKTVNHHQKPYTVYGDS